MITYFALICEVLFYSYFMKIAKGSKKILGYIISFTIATIINMLLNTTQLYTYILFIYISLILIHYLTKDKTGMYDMITILVMMLIKIIIEGITVIILNGLLKISIPTTIITFTLFKFLFLLLFSDKIYKYNRLLNKKWNKNDFNIRYITTILVLGYTIISILVLIV